MLSHRQSTWRSGSEEDPGFVSGDVAGFYRTGLHSGPRSADVAAMNRRETIEFLLENYRDVEDGLQDGGISFDGAGYSPRMCRAWSHPSYVELRRCVALLQNNEPILWWDFQQHYFRYDVKRVAYCPRCLKEAPPWCAGEQHRHGQKSATMVLKSVRKRSLAIKPKNVKAGIGYVDLNFRGEPFVPDDLLSLAA